MLGLYFGDVLHLTFFVANYHAHTDVIFFMIFDEVRKNVRVEGLFMVLFG